MKLPTRKQAEKYFEDFHVPDNIKQHCFVVNKVAVFLAEKLKASGETIDLEIVDRLSLLHDLFKPLVIKIEKDIKFKSYPTEKQKEFWKKMQEKYKGMHETEVFAAIFGRIFPEFSELVLHYGDHNIFTSEKSREEQIVHYADWRVYLDRIISLKERTDDLFIRYKKKIMAHPDGKSQWEKRVADEFAVEESICSRIKIKPDELATIK